jgi:hypothetical protein
MAPMIDPTATVQTHTSLETRPHVQTHTMLEKTHACDTALNIVSFPIESPFAAVRLRTDAAKR